MIIFDGEPIVELDETVRDIRVISAIVILFVAGLEITPREFLRGEAASFTVGSIGVIVPFFVGFVVLFLRIKSIGVYASSYSTYSYPYCNICPSIDRIRKDADKGDIRCCNSG